MVVGFFSKKRGVPGWALTCSTISRLISILPRFPAFLYLERERPTNRRWATLPGDLAPVHPRPQTISLEAILQQCRQFCSFFLGRVAGITSDSILAFFSFSCCSWRRPWRQKKMKRGLASFGCSWMRLSFWCGSTKSIQSINQFRKLKTNDYVSSWRETVFMGRRQPLRMPPHICGTNALLHQVKHAVLVGRWYNEHIFLLL